MGKQSIPQNYGILFNFVKVNFLLFFTFLVSVKPYNNNIQINFTTLQSTLSTYKEAISSLKDVALFLPTKRQ